MQIIKRVPNAFLYSNGCIRIDNVRGSYVHAAYPYKSDSDPADKLAKYSMVSLLPKSTHDKARELILESINAILRDKNKGAPIKSDARFFRDGDDAARAEYVDHWTVNCSEERAPSCRNKQGELILLRDGNGEIVTKDGVAVRDVKVIADQFQSGFWFNVLIRPWWQDNKFGKKVNAGFVAAQFVKKDKTFGDGAIDDSDVWGAVEDGGFGHDGL